MVRGALNKRLIRHMIHIWGQALAIMAVVLLGTASYISMSSAHKNLLLSRDVYYQQYDFADFFISLERAPASMVYRLEDIPGVRAVRGRIVKDALVDIPGVDEPRNIRMISMPERNRAVLNGVHVLSGRYFDEGVTDQVVLSQDFALHNNLQPGDRINVTLDGRQHSLRISGLGMSPEYIYVVRNAQDFIPSPERFGIIWVPETFAEMALDMPGSRNDFVGSVEEPERLDEILSQAERLLDSYGVFVSVKREDQISHRFVTDQIKTRDALFTMIALLLMVVSAAVIMVLLGRMVHQDRTEIGLLKAFGYSNFAIAWYYIKFALVMSISGSVLGMLLGHWLSIQMVYLYVDFYQFPEVQVQIYPDVFLFITITAALFALLGALAAARRAVKTHPAEAMRPEAPRHGHRTLIERWHFLWSLLGFTEKMIVRNVGRNRLRAAFCVAGVMISAAILMLGFHQMDSITYMIDLQFSELQREDVRVHFTHERNRGALLEMARLDGVRHAEPLLQYPFEIRNGWRHMDTGIIGVPENAQMTRLIDIEDRHINITGNGLVLSTPIAEKLGVHVGDVVRIKPLMGKITHERDVRVDKVVQQYIGTSAYMEISALSRILNEPFAMNVALLKMDEGTTHDLVKYLKDIPLIAAVELTAESYDALKVLLADSMIGMATIISLFSGIIAFAIIYNTTIISLMERQRELASLRVMGFTREEISRLLYQENVLLSCIGLVLGLPAGRWLCQRAVEAIDMDIMRMPFHLETSSYLYTVVLIALFVLLANLAVLRRISRLDLVAVLKQRE